MVGKPAIVTHVVDTMTDNLRPTRAEATDVANVVLGGSDAMLLGAKTLCGLYPVETISTVGKICVEYQTRRYKWELQKKHQGVTLAFTAQGTNSDLKEVANYNKVVLASPGQNLSRPNKVSHVAASPLKNVATTSEETIHSKKQLNGVAIQGMSPNKPKKPGRL